MYVFSSPMYVFSSPNDVINAGAVCVCVAYRMAFGFVYWVCFGVSF